MIGSGLSSLTVGDAQLEILFHGTNFCTLCGSILNTEIVDKELRYKVCPAGHGIYYAHFDYDGAPVLTFEPRDCF